MPIVATVWRPKRLVWQFFSMGIYFFLQFWMLLNARSSVHSLIGGEDEANHWFSQAKHGTFDNCKCTWRQHKHALWSTKELLVETKTLYTLRQKSGILLRVKLSFLEKVRFFLWVYSFQGKVLRTIVFSRKKSLPSKYEFILW